MKKYFSALTILGVLLMMAIGLSEVPDPSGPWARQVGDYLPWLSRVWPIAIIVGLMCAVAGAALNEYWRSRRQPQLRFILDNDHYSLFKVSSLRDSRMLLTSGVSDEEWERIARHQIYVGVENNGKSTARNVQLVGKRNFPPGYPVDWTFRPKSSANESVDIKPHDCALFQILEGFDKNPNVVQPLIVDTQEWRGAKQKLNDPSHRAHLTLHSGLVGPLCSATGIEIWAFADDVKPEKAFIYLRTGERIDATIYRSRRSKRVHDFVNNLKERARNVPKQIPPS
jgi:hypothetical protein